MKALQMRAEQLARAEQSRRLERLVEAMRAATPGVAVDSDDSAVVLRGRGLLQRWLADPALRFAARLSR